MASVIFGEQLEIPLGIGTLPDFRQWALSADFPKGGRIDYIHGKIEVDMSPKNLFSHGTLKAKLAQAIVTRMEELSLGHVFIDSTRISNIEAELSAEPDILVLSQAAIDDGRVRLIAAASHKPDAFVEIEGSPDLVVEIVSDSSVIKDTERLPQVYYEAGVAEFWLIDARSEPLQFAIHHRGTHQFEPTLPDTEGYQKSSVLGCDYRLIRERGLGGFWRYDLQSHLFQN
jgi:Uma2 family endonuclease